MFTYSLTCIIYLRFVKLKANHDYRIEIVIVFQCITLQCSVKKKLLGRLFFGRKPNYWRPESSAAEK